MSSWQDIFDRLRDRVRPQTFNIWFQPMKCVALDERQIVLEVPNEHYRNWITEHFLGELHSVVSDSLGSGRQIKVVAERLESQAPTQGQLPLLAESEEEQSPRPAAANEVQTQINPEYTLDAFVVGPSNEFAHAAARAVAERLADAYNPLFIYGGVGLGKTHLMHAIGNAVSLKHDARVLYLSSEQFTNDLIYCIEHKEMTAFRERYRAQCDVLLIDDIQFIAGKERTQDEFFHTFNHLFNNKKQIVLTSDKTPQEIPKLEERLQSRFMCGLLADIQKPELETRVAILKRKAAREGIVLPDEVGLYLASHTDSNIRELEGLLKRVAAKARLNGVRLDLDSARFFVEPLLRQRSANLTPERIVKLVSNFYNVRVDDMLRRGRSKQIALARQVAMYLARKHTDLSYPDLGRFFGKDHTTVLSAFQKFEKLAESHQGLRSELDALERNIHA
ncbi:MAG: chromosomal replication initiator protein DnaA [Myxococcota bacterium]|jgi:chromosomal replication initiator protein|nr:chromosomal replication initiator protein DnaA [Myxococcota bacterium]